MLMQARWSLLMLSICAMPMAHAQTSAAQSEAAEYGQRSNRPPRPDLARELGISSEQANKVHEILHAARQSGQSREATRAQLAGVLTAAQLEQLHQAKKARRAAAGGQPGANCLPRAGGQRPDAARSGS